MKRKFLALLCIAAIMVLSVASCTLLGGNGNNGGETPDTCEHTYSERWSTSSTEHWHAATCEHAELKTDIAPHKDADEDGKCDVCDYEIGHEHTFAEEWTTDDTHHWKVATCSHTEEKGELAAHTDTNSDGACDACSAHVHVLNLYGKCTVCNEQVNDVDVTDINVILPIVVSNGGKINGGSITGGSIITDLELEDDELVSYLSGNYQDVVYVLGNGSSYYKIDTTSFYGDSEYTETQENWYELLADGSVFGVYQYSYDGETSDFEVNGAASENDLVGYYFALSTLTDAYGAENLLAALYALSQSSSASEYQYGYEDGTYSFVFNYLAINTDTAEGEGDHVDYYELAVYFKASENGALTELGVVCGCYTNSLEDEIDNDYTYDQNAGTITMKDTAAADLYTFVITQVEGERTYVSEHPKSEFYPESFDAFLDEELTTELGDTATVVQDNTLVLYFGNFAPANTNAKYIMETFSTNLDDESPVYAWVYDGTASFYCNVPGTYAIEFTLGDETFSFTLVVEEYVPEEIEYPENSVPFVITGDDTYAWSALVTFTAHADGDYTFYVPAGIGAWDKAAADSWSGEPYVDFYSEFGGTFTVSVKAGETYEFYVSATEKMSSYLTYTVGDYTGDEGGSEVDPSVPQSALNVGNTTPINAANAMFYYTASANGTLTLTTGAAIMGDVQFSYSVNGGEYVALPLSTTVTLTLNTGDSVLISVVAAGYSSITAAWDGESSGDVEEPELTVTEGTYTGTDLFGNSPLTVVVEGNTVTFYFDHPMMGSSSVVATYAIVDGALVLYDENGEVLHPLAGSLTIDAEGNPTAASYNGTDYTFGNGGSAETPELDPTLELLKGYYVMTGYEVIIYGGEDYEGVYYFNAYRTGADVYYTLTAIDNADGTYTLVLALDDPSLDVFGFLAETFTATVDGETVTLAGPELEVVVVDYPDITLGDTTVTITEDDISNGSIFFDFVVTQDGYYTVSGVSGSFLTAEGDYLGYGSAVLTAGNYVLNLSVWDLTVGNATVTVSYADMSALTAEQMLGAALGEYRIDDLVYSIYGGEYYDGAYFVNIYDANTWSPDVYYVVESVVKNADGTCTIVLALNTALSETDDFGFAGDSIVISYADGWTINHNKTLKVTQGTYIGTDDFGNPLLTVVIDAETVTFTFNHPMMGISTSVATYAIVDGAVVLYDELGNVLNPLAGFLTINENGLPVAAGYNGNNYTLAAEGGAEEEENDSVLTLGENTITVVDNDMGDTYFLPVNESETVTYVITVGANGVLIVDGYDIHFEGEQVEITVLAGATVSVGIGAYSFSDNVAHFTLAVKESVEGGDNGDDEGGNTDAPALQGDGTASNPYVITTLPYEIVYTGAHDVYYTFVATEDCVLTITYTAGSYVSGLVSFDKDSTNCVYTVYCKAGEVIQINTWTMSAADTTYTYVVSYSA